jgi:hypothetical protein
MDIITTQWAARPSKLFRVLGTWAASASTTNFLLGGNSSGLTNLWPGAPTAYQHFDVVAIAPYFEENVPDALSAGGAGLTSLFQEINSGGAIPSPNAANTTTNSGNNYSLTSSSACGNGAIASIPSNGTITCLKPNVTNTGNATLTVDGGTQYPLYSVTSSTDNIGTYQLASSSLNTSTKYCATFTSSTGATAWSGATNYGANFLVSGSDGNTYFSVAGSNLNNNPVGDGGIHWTAITPAWWLFSCNPSVGGMLVSTVSSEVSNQVSELAAMGISLPLVCYESGSAIENIADTFTYYLMQAASQDARFTPAYVSFYSQIYAAGLTGVCNHYNDFGWSIFGTWGFAPSLYNSTGVAPPTAKENGLTQFIGANHKTTLPYLLKRDFDPASNDNRPVGVDIAA